MNTELKPSSTQFVAQVGSAAAAAQLESVPKAETSEIPGHPGLRLVEITSKSKDAQENWRKLRESLGEGVELTPVYIDSDAMPRYPTGKVMVRFPKLPSKKELNAFVEKFGLKVTRQNKYVPSQYEFESVEGKDYLPELITRARNSLPESAVIWPDTISEFKRG